MEKLKNFKINSVLIWSSLGILILVIFNIQSKKDSINDDRRNLVSPSRQTEESNYFNGLDYNMDVSGWIFFKREDWEEDGSVLIFHGKVMKLELVITQLRSNEDLELEVKNQLNFFSNSLKEKNNEVHFSEIKREYYSTFEGYSFEYSYLFDGNYYEGRTRIFEACNAIFSVSETSKGEHNLHRYHWKKIEDSFMCS